MVLDRPLALVIASILAVAAVVAAAKLHGRQLRIEREHEGIHQVVFGGVNPPFVESLWRADRVRFWIASPLSAVVLGAFVLATRGADVGVLLLASFAWAPFLGFGFCTSLSARRLARRGAPVGAWRGTIGWSAVAFALGASSVVLAL